MEQSSNELCGHDRDVLRLVLHVWSVPGLRAGTVLTSNQQSAHDDTNNPAKLAELLTERGREFGIEVRNFTHSFHFVQWKLLLSVTPQTPESPFIVWNDERKHRPTALLKPFWEMTMPQARAILAAWLELQDGEADKAMEALTQYNQQPRQP